ncbi:MAG: beta-ketoacyl synthase N-terminal-like domain-containing protein, partial [Bacteroidales bacterium]|nr:beta-ketoacyl synthase N-terminal-like domain-containing protein [Bacteroidales bacterium]
MQMRRVVVTGLGALTPIGLSVPEFWDSLVKG